MNQNLAFDVEADCNPVFQGSDTNPFTAEETPWLKWSLYDTDTFVIMSLTLNI